VVRQVVKLMILRHEWKGKTAAQGREFY
ncbi:MAG: hypothetical protein RLZZ502_471, partial [Pseudomonadota bacterium]